MFHFKTSHVIVYQTWQCNTVRMKHHFKTSYVIVYRELDFRKFPFKVFQNILCYCLSICEQWCKFCKKISKHLMLLFISLCAWRTKIQTYFKTSYVIVYQSSVITWRRQWIISKHLMLLFIYFQGKELITLSEFQNILCYCLSTIVLVYDNQFTLFQNILCYCLSLAFPRF